MAKTIKCTPEIRNKTRVLSFTTVVQFYTGSSIHNKEEGNERHPYVT